MKSIMLLFILGFVPLITRAQVQIRPLPLPGYEKRIKSFINDMTVVDTHEHLMSPSQLKQKTSLDFMLLLQHYSAEDIKSAGMPDRTFAMLLNDSIEIKEKWQILRPYWESSLNTAYNRVAILAADKLFGINDINESTILSLSEKISKVYQTDWINNVINKRCKIEYLIQNSEDRNFNNERFRYVGMFDNFILVNSKQKIIYLAKQQNKNIETLDDLIDALGNAFQAAKEKGIVGIKTALAYRRILYYENTERKKAQEIFELLINDKEETQFSFTEVLKPLQDYMMHRVLDIAKLNKIPIIFHTGLLAGNGNIIENSKPTHLVNLFKEYPDVNFVLYHGSYPYGGELATLAKNFANVYIDMCWLYVISPSYSERYLHEWIETVPASKIMGFGGDYQNVENIYGHLLLAKQVISRVLINKVKDGYLSESEAKTIAQMILHDNAIKLYKLAM